MTIRVGKDIVDLGVTTIDGVDYYSYPTNAPDIDEVEAIERLASEFKQKDPSCFEPIKLSKDDISGLCELPTDESLLDGAEIGENLRLFPDSCDDATSKVGIFVSKVKERIAEYQQAMDGFQKLELEYFYGTMINAYYGTFLIKYTEYSEKVTKIVDQLSSLDGDDSTPAKLKRERLESQLDTILSFGDDRIKNLDDFKSKFGEYRRRSVRASNDISNQVDPKYEDKLYYKLFVGYDTEIKRGYLDDLYGYESDLLDELDQTDEKFMEQYSHKSRAYRDDVFYPRHDDTLQSIEAAADKLARFASSVNLDPVIIDGFDLEAFDSYANDRVDEFESVKARYDDVINIKNDISSLIESLKTEMAELCTKQKVDGDDSVEPGQSMDFNGMPDQTLPQLDSLKYWQKFAAYATIANLLPIYWQVGLLVPSPSGVVRVKLPTIWVALAVLPLPGRMLVIFLGICGVVPSPFIWEWRFPPFGEGSSHFLLSWRKANWKIKDKTGTETLPLPILNGEDVVPPISRTKLFVKDDLPVWERMSPLNPLFLSYLNKFCSAGKEGAGFP